MSESKKRLRKIADGDVGAPGDAGASEWYSRGYLPHRDRAGLLQMITFRLADSLPQEKLRTLESELAQVPDEQQDAARRKRIEEWLDAGMGCCALRHPAVAQQVRDSLFHFHGERYTLGAWCIMPNHVHVILEPTAPISQVVQGWKSFTARWALAHNEELKLGIPGTKHLWQREYWDRYIRNEEHLHRAVEYIHNNPVKAGLCEQAEEWAWSSGSANVPVGNFTQVPTGTSALPEETKS